MSEILGALFKYLLAIIGIAAVVVVLYEALGSNKTSTAVSNITQIQSNIAQLYAGSSGTTDTLSTAGALIGAGVIPASMVSGQNIVDPWGQTDTVGTPVEPVAAQISLPAVPNSACAKLVMAILPIVNSVSVNSATAVSNGAAVSDVAADCAKAPASGLSVVQINFSSSGSN